MINRIVLILSICIVSYYLNTGKVLKIFIKNTPKHAPKLQYRPKNICPNIQNITASDIKFKLNKDSEVHNKPWSKSNKYLVAWNTEKFMLKTDNANFEIIYHLISKILNLKHSKYPVYFTTIGKNIVMNKWYNNIKHGWNTYPFCTNVSNIYTFHVLYNDFLMGYSDRAPVHTLHNYYLNKIMFMRNIFYTI